MHTKYVHKVIEVIEHTQKSSNQYFDTFDSLTLQPVKAVFQGPYYSQIS